MPATPIYGLPYPDPSDIVRDHPADHQALAGAVEGALHDAAPRGIIAAPAGQVSFGAADTAFPAGLDVNLAAGRTYLIVLEARQSDPAFTTPALVVLTPYLNGQPWASGFHVGIAAPYVGLTIPWVYRPPAAQTLRWWGRAASGGTYVATYTVRVVDLGGAAGAGALPA